MRSYILKFLTGIENSRQDGEFLSGCCNFTSMIKVFYLKITDPVFFGLGIEDFRPWMEPSKFAIVQAYRSDKVKREKWLGEWLIRRVLQQVYGLSPQEYMIEREEGGKPYLTGQTRRIYFNLSHSGEYVVCAFSDAEIGADIEKIGHGKMSLARRFFHPEEIRVLEEAGEPKCKELFFTYWSVKESFLKYKGTGLRCPLSSFAVSDRDGEIRIRQGETYLPVYVRECKIDPGYKCFICSEETGIPEIVRFTEWQAFPG